MRKFFGTCLISFGTFWGAMHLIIGFNCWSDFSAASIITTVVLIAIGLFVLWLGRKVYKGKNE